MHFPYIEYVRERLRRLGPHPDLDRFEQWAQVLQKEAVDPRFTPAWIEQFVDGLTQDRVAFEYFDTAARRVESRGGRLPPWASWLLTRIQSGEIKRPRGGGQPPGVGGIADPLGRFNLALDVWLVGRLIEEHEHVHVPLYTSTGNQENTVAEIVVRACQAEGMQHVTPDVVGKCFKEYRAVIELGYQVGSSETN